MGSDPAPFWANLYLHRHEYIYMSALMKNNISSAHRFHGCKRFIDDMICLNDNQEFENSYRQIYPKELELKCEHAGSHATFLDLDIKIEEGMFIYKLFDKRDAFKFDIVRMPHKMSNIPMKIFFASIISESLRIARSTLRITNLIPKIAEFVKRMINQGGDKYKILKQINKAMVRHPETFNKYQTPKTEILNMIGRHTGSSE